jgi:hypothetical protein
MSGIVQTLGYEWCALRAGSVITDDLQTIRTLSGKVLIYCRVEQWSEGHQGGVRKVPVKLDELDTVAT